jgi:dinuclear metal center YbgI/SA1388 family protein
MQLDAFCERLDERLDTAAYADLDVSANGLQIGPEVASVDHVAFAVDAAVQTIEKAVTEGADVLVVHHGLIWDDLERVTGKHFRRIAPLVRNDIALYVSHLPLDGHQTLGNAAGVGDVLGLEDREPFGELGSEYIGQAGRVGREPYSPDSLRETLETELEPLRSVQLLDFGPDTIEDVAIVTGSGVDWIDQAVEHDVDAFVTGEGKQSVYHDAREAGVNVYLAGHYATETFGVRSLRALAEDWGLDTSFIDVPTGL